MSADHQGREPKPRRSAANARWIAPAFLLGAGLLYFAVPQVAQSQINGRVMSPPDSSTATRAAEKPSLHAALPKAPKQVELPAPPPMRYVPGMAEPLVAVGPVTDDEGTALTAALAAFHDAPAKAGPGGDFDDFAKPLLAFMEAHPKSNWNAALLTNIGFGYYHDGYYSRAMASWQEAWEQGRNATSVPAARMIDRAVGELAKMHARVGHDKELDALFAETDKRPIGGPATETMQSAHAGRWAFKHTPEISYLCGPKALGNVLLTLKASPKQLKVADDALSGPHGFSLEQLGALADKAGLKHTLIHREPGQPIPVPSIINWNVNHYAAITAVENGLYFIKDPTFSDGGTKVVTQKAIDAEGSGYFLVPAKAMTPKNGWRTVAAHSEEAKKIYGMGMANGAWRGCNDCADGQKVGTAPISVPDTITGEACNGDPAPQPTPQPPPPDTCPGTQTGIPPMTVASAMPMVVGLHLADTPVGYSPEIGVATKDAITYNSREDVQPANFSFSNLSGKWAHGWQAYIEDDPVHTGSIIATRVAGGGGGYYYPSSQCSTSTGLCDRETQDNAQVKRIPATGTPTSWERAMPDGGKEVYGLSDGATTNPRRMFLTQVIDAAGNTSTISYDTSFRVTSITDAMGRSMTYTYGLTDYPLLITQITDPFGRTAQFTYDTSQRLASITDPIGITSSFTYSTTDPSFVTTLTTPYGTSTFSEAINPNDTPETDTRSLTLTDPLGYTDYLYFYQNPSITPSSDPSGTIPSGMTGITNTLLQWRNTYYWNKHAFAQGVTTSGGIVQSEDFSKAALTHWYHHGNPQDLNTTRTFSSIKQLLENRVWYTYWEPGNGLASGWLDIPVQVGRVLDSGATQLSKKTFDTGGLLHGATQTPWPLTVTDPLGRGSKYTYAANKIDMLTVQQLTTTPSTYTTIGTYASYNSQHEPQTYTDAAGQVWHFTYNTVGQIATMTDPNSGVTSFNYDTYGDLYQCTSGPCKHDCGSHRL